MLRELPDTRQGCHDEQSAQLLLRNRDQLFAVNPLTDERWGTLSDNHPAASLFHSTRWLRALHSAYGYEPIAYSRCDPASELTSAVVFCKVKSALTGPRLVSLPFSDHCDPLVGNKEEFDSLLISIRENMAQERWKYYEIRPTRFEPGLVTGFAPTGRYVWHAIDLRAGLSGIFENFHNSVRRKIQRAEREGLTYEEGNTERLLEHFYKLVLLTRRRQGLPPQPRKWFQCLSESFNKGLKIRTAFRHSQPVASVLTLENRDTVTYKYGCSDERLHRLGGVALVHWNMIQQSKAEGFQKLDLGRGELGNEGLTVFKERWGGIRSYLNYWRYPDRPRSYERFASKVFMTSMVKASPDWLLVSVGSLLYRHIG